MTGEALRALAAAAPWVVLSGAFTALGLATIARVARRPGPGALPLPHEETHRG